MSLESIIESWKEVRNGLIDEANQIPAEKFSFQPTPDTRSVKQLLQHLVESQKFLVGEACRPDTNLMRGSFADNVKQYAPNVRDVEDRKSTRLNSSHLVISYAVFCLKKTKT